MFLGHPPLQRAFLAHTTSDNAFTIGLYIPSLTSQTPMSQPIPEKDTSTETCPFVSADDTTSSKCASIGTVQEDLVESPKAKKPRVDDAPPHAAPPIPDSTLKDIPTLPNLRAQEDSVGITAYVSSATHPIHAIIKHRIEDFHVHEVDIQGNIVRLTSLNIPKEFKKNSEEEQGTNGDEGVTGTQDSNDPNEQASASASSESPSVQVKDQVRLSLFSRVR